MRYKIHYEPLYELECIRILSNIIFDKSIKTDMDAMIARRGNKHKPVIAQFFKASLEMEKYIKKHVQYNMPGYESNGQQLAEFLFKERSIEDRFLAGAIYYRNQLVEDKIENHGAAIIAALDDDYLMTQIESDCIPAVYSANEFFAILEKCHISDMDKLDAMRMYHNFDLYMGYYDALISQVTGLIKTHRPNIINEITPLMDKLTAEIETLVPNEFNITIDDKHLLTVYPGIYKVSSGSIMAVGYAERAPMVIGLHVLDITATFKEADAAGDSAEAFLKCISDTTKLNILKLLKNGSMYGSQLAEKLNCSGANISHHTSAMLSLGIVHMEKENNRIYVHMNKEKIIQYIDDLKELF